MNGFWMVIVGLIVMDAIVLAFVLRQKFGRAGAVLQKPLDITSVHQRIADYMRANYSGHAEQLPEALRGLIPIVEEYVRERGLTLDRDGIDLVVVTSLIGHKITTRSEAEAALQQLREESRAAA